jgi:hypothetical protein
MGILNRLYSREVDMSWDRCEKHNVPYEQEGKSTYCPECRKESAEKIKEIMIGPDVMKQPRAN